MRVCSLVDDLEQLDFELQMLVVSLKELTATKEVIQTLEQLLCDDASQLEDEHSQVHTHLTGCVMEETLILDVNTQPKILC